MAGRTAPRRRPGEIGVSLRLSRRAIDPERRGISARQFQRHNGAGVARHYSAHETAQIFGVGRLAWFAGRHIGRAKAFQRPEDTGLQQCHQIVKLDEVVLYRRCCEQHQETLVEPDRYMRPCRIGRANDVGLVDDDDVEAAFAEIVGVLGPPRRGDRRDDALLVPERLRRVARQIVMGGGEGEAELGFELLTPLTDERGWCQHQYVFGHAAQRILLEHHTRFDGLAEPDFVGEEYPAAELFQDLADGRDLMPQRRKTRKMRQAQQLIESLRQAEMGKPLAQAEPAAVRFGLACGGVRQRRKVHLYRQRHLDVDPRERW